MILNILGLLYSPLWICLSFLSSQSETEVKGCVRERPFICVGSNLFLVTRCRWLRYLGTPTSLIHRTVFLVPMMNISINFRVRDQRTWLKSYFSVSSTCSVELALFIMLVCIWTSTRAVVTVLVQICLLQTSTRASLKLNLTLKAVITNIKMKIFNLK